MIPLEVSRGQARHKRPGYTIYMATTWVLIQHNWRPTRQGRQIRIASELRTQRNRRNAVDFNYQPDNIRIVLFDWIETINLTNTSVAPDLMLRRRWEITVQSVAPPHLSKDRYVCMFRQEPIMRLRATGSIVRLSNTPVGAQKYFVLQVADVIKDGHDSPVLTAKLSYPVKSYTDDASRTDGWWMIAEMLCSPLKQIKACIVHIGTDNVYLNKWSYSVQWIRAWYCTSLLVDRHLREQIMI